MNVNGEFNFNYYPKWSYAKTDENGRVVEVAKKIQLAIMQL